MTAVKRNPITPAQEQIVRDAVKNGVRFNALDGCKHWSASAGLYDDGHGAEFNSLSELADSIVSCSTPELVHTGPIFFWVAVVLVGSAAVAAVGTWARVFWPRLGQ